MLRDNPSDPLSPIIFYSPAGLCWYEIALAQICKLTNSRLRDVIPGLTLADDQPL
jgi:hypothetical protein